MKNITLTLGGLLALCFSVQSAVFQESGGRVVIEAERFDSRTRHAHADGQDHHWHVSPTDDGTDFLADFADPFSSFRGTGYIQVLPNGPGGGGPNIDPMVRYKAYIQTPGRYQLYLRWRGASGSDDSLYAAVSTLADGPGGSVADWYRYSQASGTDFAGSWQGNAGFERTDASGNNTPATWQISTPGIYTIVLSQREDGAAVDALVFQLSNLGAPDETGPAESALSTTFPPAITGVSPTGSDVPPGTPIRIQIENGGSTQVAPNSVRVQLNGSALAPLDVQQQGGVTTVVGAPATLLPAGSTNTVVVVFQDNASAPQSFTNTFRFVVASYATLAADAAFPLSAADAAAPGFRARVVQANTISGTLPNTIARAEAQLAGTLIDPATGQPYINEANTTGAGPDGYFVDANVINWNQDAGFGGEVGSFQAPAFPDEPIPGIPGVDGINTDNIAAEVLTFLELKAGAHTLGVNSDDGFAVGVAPDARDVFRSTVGFFNAGRGAADTLFSFVAPTDGLYPFRLIWFEGNGGANLEFFSVNAATGQKILINDRTNANAIRAWRQVTAPTRPFISAVSPTPGAVGVPVESTIDVTFTNGGATVNTNSIQITLGGQAIPLSSIAVSGSSVRVIADPPGNLVGTSNYVAQISYTTSDNAAIVRTLEFRTVRTPIALPPLRQNDAGLVVIEAENFDANVPSAQRNWVFTQTPAGYTGDGTMTALPDSDLVINYPDTLTSSPRLDYKVQFNKTGTHYLWFRGSDGGGDSLNAGINGDSPNETMNNIDENCCGDRLVPNGVSFTWVGGIDGTPQGRSQFEVTQAGIHTINLWMREDGQIVDKVLITTDPNYIPTGAGPAESGRVGDPFRPTISITSPTSDQRLPVGSPVNITVDANDRDGQVAKVEFFEGSNKIGEDTTAPFSFSFQPAQERPYTITASATDNTGLQAVSGAVKFIYGNPPAILFFGNDPLANAGDLALINRLESQGFLVTAIDDNASDPSQAQGHSLIIISSTVSSGNISSKFTDSTLPIINWEEALFDELLMTGDSGADPDHHGSTGGLSQVDILNPSHALAAGLSGTVTVTSSPQTMSWGVSDANPTNAIVIARVSGDPTKWAIWAFEKGATLFDGTPAPERRVGFFFNGNSVAANTPEAFQLFDAALNWALRRTVVAPPTLSIARQGEQLSISWAPPGGVLESTTNLSDPASWAPVSNASNPHLTPPTDTKRFYRVRR